MAVFYVRAIDILQGGELADGAGHLDTPEEAVARAVALRTKYQPPLFEVRIMVSHWKTQADLDEIKGLATQHGIPLDDP